MAEQVAADLAAWRERGDDRFDPVRFRFIEAMARRAEAHDGEARRLLDDKVAQLLSAYREALETSRSVDARTEEAEPGRSALAELVAHIARHAPPPGEGLAENAPAPDLKAVSYFRSTWSKLSADRRLHQSLAKVPDNAGPLNSHHLVHRALILMRDLSPEYLNRFMSYVDSLLWIDQANGSMASAAATTPRAETPKKSGRGKSA
ncbi:DUF2894 domain-containing protein [Variovorax paradoxus]|uniref:DUF2894 domain-containing protein n=1 Tax=Variovorax paradoxus TaxID=34073 RepID=UPI0030D20DC1